MNITQRKLSDCEIGILVDEMHNFPDVGLYTGNQWRGFEHIFVLENKDKLIGVCVVIPLKSWVKIGPVIILKSCQGKGYGKKLLGYVVGKYRNKNIYIGSSNKKVVKIMERLKFQRVDSFFNLPGEIKSYLAVHFFRRINWDFLVDSLPKISRRSGKYCYFVQSPLPDTSLFLAESAVL